MMIRGMYPGTSPELKLIIKCGCLMFNLFGVAVHCEVQGTYERARKQCDNHEFCFLFAHVDNDPCPSTSKYLEVVYSCEQSGRWRWRWNWRCVGVGVGGCMCACLVSCDKLYVYK